MRKLVIAMIIAIGCSIQAAEASIHRMYDNAQNAVYYHTSKKIMGFSKIWVLEVDKTARPGGTGEFILQIKFGGTGVRKYKIIDTAYVIVDGTRYPISKVIVTRIGAKPDRVFNSAYYIVPSEIEDKIASYNDYVWFEFGVDGKKPTVIKMNAKEQEEVRLIAKLRYDDFDAFSKGEIKPNPPKQK